MTPKIKKFERNTKGRDFVVGDIHGCFTLLEKALTKIGFNYEADRLFSVGDLGDRGPESEQSVEWLGKPWFHAIRGNHEDMAMRFVVGQWPAYNFMENGGRWLVELDEGEQAVYALMFNELPIAIEIDTPQGRIGLVHAQINVKHWDQLEGCLTGPKADFYEEICLWERDKALNDEPTHVEGVRAVILGHTPFEKATWLGNCFYIDTGAVFAQRRDPNENRLTIVNLTDLEIVHGPV